MSETSHPAEFDAQQNDPETRFAEARGRLDGALAAGDKKAIIQALADPEILSAYDDPEHGPEWEAQTAKMLLSGFVDKESKERARAMFDRFKTDGGTLQEFLEEAGANPTIIAGIQNVPRLREEFVEIATKLALHEHGESVTDEQIEKTMLIHLISTFRKEMGQESELLSIDIPRDELDNAFRDTLESMRDTIVERATKPLLEEKERARAAYESQIAILKEENNRLHEEARTSVADNAKRNVELVAEKDGYKKDAARIPDLEEENRVLREQHETMRRTLEEKELFQKDLDEERLLRAETEAENKRLHGSIQDIRGMQKGLEAKAESLQIDHEAVERQAREMSDLRQAVEAERMRVADLEGQLHERTEQVHQASLAEQRLQQELQARTRENHSINNERNRIAEALKAEEEKNRDLSDKYANTTVAAGEQSVQLRTSREQNDRTVNSAKDAVHRAARHLQVMTEEPEDPKQTASDERADLPQRETSDVGHAMETQQSEINVVPPMPEKALQLEKRPSYFVTPQSGDAVRGLEFNPRHDASYPLPNVEESHDLGSACDWRGNETVIQFSVVRLDGMSEWILLTRPYVDSKPVQDYWEAGGQQDKYRSVADWQRQFAKMYEAVKSDFTWFDPETAQFAEEIEQQKQAEARDFVQTFERLGKNEELSETLQERIDDGLSLLPSIENYHDTKRSSLHFIHRIDAFERAVVNMTRSGGILSQDGPLRHKFAELDPAGNANEFDAVLLSIDRMVWHDMHDMARRMTNTALNEDPHPAIQDQLHAMKQNQFEPKRLALVLDRTVGIVQNTHRWVNDLINYSKRINAQLLLMGTIMRELDSKRQHTGTQEERQFWQEFSDAVRSTVSAAELIIIEPPAGEKYSSSVHKIVGTDPSQSSGYVVRTVAPGLGVPNELDEWHGGLMAADVIVGEGTREVNTLQEVSDAVQAAIDLVPMPLHVTRNGTSRVRTNAELVVLGLLMHQGVASSDLSSRKIQPSWSELADEVLTKLQENEGQAIELWNTLIDEIKDEQA